MQYLNKAIGILVKPYLHAAINRVRFVFWRMCRWVNTGKLATFDISELKMHQIYDADVKENCNYSHIFTYTDKKYMASSW
jgi:hypothetical protein